MWSKLLVTVLLSLTVGILALPTPPGDFDSQLDKIKYDQYHGPLEIVGRTFPAKLTCNFSKSPPGSRPEVFELNHDQLLTGLKNARKHYAHQLDIGYVHWSTFRTDHTPVLMYIPFYHYDEDVKPYHSELGRVRRIYYKPGITASIWRAGREGQGNAATTTCAVTSTPTIGTRNFDSQLDEVRYDTYPGKVRIVGDTFPKKVTCNFSKSPPGSRPEIFILNHDQLLAGLASATKYYAHQLDYGHADWSTFRPDHWPVLVTIPFAYYDEEVQPGRPDLGRVRKLYYDPGIKASIARAGRDGQGKTATTTCAVTL